MTTQAQVHGTAALTCSPGTRWRGPRLEEGELGACRYSTDRVVLRLPPAAVVDIESGTERKTRKLVQNSVNILSAYSSLTSSKWSGRIRYLVMDISPELVSQSIAGRGRSMTLLQHIGVADHYIVGTMLAQSMCSFVTAHWWTSKMCGS
jgi:hypothetical protein